jgi:hypothetical protein
VRRPDSTYPVIVKPYKLDLSQIGETVRDEMKFTIENVSETDLDLSLIDDRKDLFQLELPETIPAGKTAEVSEERYVWWEVSKRPLPDTVQMRANRKSRLPS